MSVSYTAVGWNRHKRIYDAVMLGCVAAYLVAFVAAGKILFRPPGDFTDPVLLIRGLGTCAIIMLHVVLWIGPLARIHRRFLPLLYNRRHLGVTTFLTANTAYGSLSRFPFETLGLIALIILFLLAATSHDFWLKNLSPRVWKGLHMSVYAAYALLVMHVALGSLQSERNAIYVVLLGAGAGVTVILHVIAGAREHRVDSSCLVPRHDGLIDAGSVDEIPNNRARAVCLPGQDRIAIYKYDGKVSAVSNVCAHQGGPLSEGKIVDGCITCPWHGYQYLPGNGQSPPPFTDKIRTYRVRVEGRRILLNPDPLPPGTPVEPATFDEPIAS